MSDIEASILIKLILEDLEQSTYMSSMWLILSKKQKDNLKKRWISILKNGILSNSGNY